MSASHRLPAEWEPQSGVLMIWPHAATDWAPVLAEVEPVFAEIAAAISRYQTVLMIAGNGGRVRAACAAAGGHLPRLQVVDLPSNDTWARDCLPLTVVDDTGPLLLDFTFNGWGMKFAADQDNQLGRRLQAAGCFGSTPLSTQGLVLEGGSIESDGEGTLLTTALCLDEANRNPHLNRAEIEAAMQSVFGLHTVHWLEHGCLQGDDTDGHIDTLARLAPGGGIVYQGCADPADGHYAELQAMAVELRDLRRADGTPYTLYPLPWPAPVFGGGGERLPATYANYLIVNGAVLVPTYRQPERDAAALAVIAAAHPGRAVEGIDCLPLMQQHGSLHCLTMQMPVGVLPTKEDD